MCRRSKSPNGVRLYRAGTTSTACYGDWAHLFFQYGKARRIFPWCQKYALVCDGCLPWAVIRNGKTPLNVGFSSSVRVTSVWVYFFNYNFLREARSKTVCWASTSRLRWTTYVRSSERIPNGLHTVLIFLVKKKNRFLAHFTIIVPRWPICFIVIRYQHTKDERKNNLRKTVMSWVKKVISNKCSSLY